jgi:uncharacterized protein YkwD
MEGLRIRVVIGAVVAGLLAGGTAAALPGDPLPGITTLTGVTTVVNGITTVTDVTVPVTVPSVPDASVPSVPSIPTVPDVTVPTVPDVTTPTVPIDDSTPLPPVPTGDALPPIVVGTVDATSQIVTTPSDAPLPGFTPTLSDVSAFGTVVQPGSQAGPEVLRLVAPDSPAVGKPVSFSIAAQDDDVPVSGVSFDFGEPGARFAEAYCRSNARAHHATFSVPYTFARAGRHVVRFELSSGACDSASRVTAGQVTVDVAQGTANVRAVTGPDVGVLTKHCPNSDILPTRSTRTKVRTATLCLLNSVRRRAGLHTLSSVKPLRRIAAEHSRDMVSRGYFDHTEPPHRTFVARLRSVGWRKTAGENIGYGTAFYATARAMMWAWMHSSGHRANILYGRFHHVGIAISIGAPSTATRQAGTYTTDFGA